MVKRQGLWRPRPTIDQAEFEAAQVRVAARLADLFGLEAPASDADVSPADPPTEANDALEADSPTEADQDLEAATLDPPLWPGAPRPAIVVDRQPDLVDIVAEPARAEPDLVGATARPDEAWDSPIEADQDLEAATLDPPLWPGAPRPAIVVDRQPDLVDIVAEPARAEPDLVGVMARPNETVAAAVASDPVTAAVPLARRSAAVPRVAAPGAQPSRRPKATAAVSDPVTAAVPLARRSAAVPRVAAPGAQPSRRPKAPAAVSDPVRVDAGAKVSRPGIAPAGRPAVPRPTKARRKTAPAPAAAAASCPYCAVLLQPPPVSSQRCAHCRQRIIVKRVAGRAAYLTEAAVLVFEAERRRLAGSGRLTRERERWLKLATAAGAPPERAARLAATQLSEDVVEAARALYLTAIERSFQVAKRERRWEDASRTRREHALVLYRLAGSPVPPSAEIIKVHRDGVAAELRGIAEITRDAELVGATCCDACRADDGQIFKITVELRVPRLPHDGCPKGLCHCRWNLPARHRTAVQRYLRRRARQD